MEVLVFTTFIYACFESLRVRCFDRLGVHCERIARQGKSLLYTFLGHLLLRTGCLVA